MGDVILREVKFSAYHTANGVKYLDTEQIGLFHQFADDPFSENGVYFAHTVALIEAVNGRMLKVPVDKFKFNS